MIELTILMPCLDEAETIERCIRKARSYLERSSFEGEILIADNGSADGSQAVAARSGARVIDVPARGYGAALLAGIREARGRFVIMGDADDSYAFASLDNFVAKLQDGFDLVMGNRFQGGILRGAMPPLHRFLGNPVLSALGRLFFRSPVGDFHCGLRGFRRDAILGLNLTAPGMEFASEMVVKATLKGLSITEVPTTLSPDGRSRPPHLRSWSDGWRHLRFMLLLCPRWLFFYPAVAMLFAGLIGTAALLPGPIIIGSVTFDVQTMAVACFMQVLGLQTLVFAFLAQRFLSHYGPLPKQPFFERLSIHVTLERILAIGSIIGATGLAGLIFATGFWAKEGFGPLDFHTTMRIVLTSTTAMTLGAQLMSSAFLSGIFESYSPRAGSTP